MKIYKWKHSIQIEYFCLFYSPWQGALFGNTHVKHHLEGGDSILGPNSDGEILQGIISEQKFIFQ